MEDFLKREAMTGNIKKDGKVVFPPRNRTDWSGMSKQIFNWLRDVAYIAEWDPDDCLVAFPASTSDKDIDELHKIRDMVRGTAKLSKWEQYVGKPTPVDGTPVERLKEHIAGRKDLCIYDKDMQAAPLIHFPTDDDRKYKTRMLVYFYAFLFFQDWNQDLWMKVIYMM